MGALPGPGSLSQGSDSILSDARSAAEQSLHDAYPGKNVQMPGGGGGSTSTSASVSSGPPPASDAYTAEPPDDAVDMASVIPSTDKGPPADATPMKPAQTHGNGDLWSGSNLHDFLRDEFKGSGEELGKGVMRSLAEVGKTGYMLSAGAAAAVADKVAKIATGHEKTGAEDAVFDFQKKYIDPAIEHWTPERQSVTGEGDGSGGAAQALGGAAGIIPAMATGPAGAAALITSTGMNTAAEGIDKGHSVRTALATGAIDALATAIQMHLPGADLPLVRRILTQVPMGDVAAVAGELAKKKVLASAGHQKEADAIDPLSSLGENTVQNIVFAAMGGKGKAKDTAVPPTDAEPMPAAQPANPPPEAVPMPAAQGASPLPSSGEAIPSPKVSQVPDTPSPEPAADLKAQFADMNDAKTPRTGVLVPKGSEGSTGKALDQARTQGRVIDMPQGSLVLKNKGEFLKAQAALKAGTDPQAVIGKATGAGGGKSPEHTHVVQGHTPEGNVAVESMVTPAEVPAKVAEVKAQGKIPVVTTPDGAVARRAGVIAQEKAAEAAKPLADEKTEPVTESKPSDEDVEDEGPPVQRGIIKTGGGERAVIIHDAKPDAEGKIRVSALDKDGEPGPEMRVPADALRGAREELDKSAKESTPQREDVVESKPAPAAAEPRSSPPLPEGGGSATAEPTSKKPAPIMEQLSDAASQFESGEQPPKGKKFPGSVKDRAGNVANFARVLKGVAQSLTGKAPVADLQHAIAVAKKAERLDLKSDEAIAKNQGVGHTELATHADNLLHAARKLIDPAYERPEPKSSVQEKLKAKVAKKVAGPVVREKPKAEEKVKVIADVEDETKPKVLSKQDQARLKAAGDKLIKAKDEDLDARRTDVEKIIEEVYGHRMADDDRKMFMSFLEGERRDRLRPKSRDEEIDEEFQDHRHENGDEDAEHKILGAHEVSPEMHTLTDRLEKSGMFPKLREAAKNNMQFPADRLLQHMAGNTPAGPLRDFITKLAAHLPAGASVRPVDKIITSSGQASESAAGYYSRADRASQVVIRNPGDGAKMTHTILHELVHAATMEMAADRAHPLTKESMRLRQIFEDRMRARLGDKVMDAHLAFHQGAGPRPAEMINHLYGLSDHKEFMAEAMSNPKFQQLIAESEKWRRPGEGFIGGAHRLADAVLGAIKRALNIVTGREAKLLHAVMRNVEDVMEAQHAKLSAENPRTAANDFAALNHLDDDPKPLREEGRIRSIVGDKAADTARQFYRSVQSGAVHAMRRLVLANETHDQIIRSNAHWFGADNEKNPLRQYEDIQQQKTAIQNGMLERARGNVIDRQKLGRAEDTKLGKFQIDSTTWGIDPDVERSKLPEKVTKQPNFEGRYTDFMNRWNALSPDAKGVYRGEREFYKWSANQTRRAAVDAALDTFTDRDITEAQRSLLYSVKTKGDFDALIGSGKLVDVGDRNESLRKSLQELAGLHQIDGPYFHLGRHGDYVVQVAPEGNKEFATQAQANAYAEKVRDFGPGSKAKVQELGGKWTVDYKAQYVSMHDSAAKAEIEAEKLRAQGHDVAQVTNKIEASSGGALSAGMQSLVAEAKTKLERRGEGPETQALTDALRGTFVQMVANRSAYAASKLARKGFAGVKPEEMGRNFASHAQSSAWNLGNLATTFKQGEALGRIREASKSPDADVPQKVVYKRGAVMREIGKRTAQEVSQYGIKNPVNAITAKIGYMGYLASPAHTFVNMTQNFTTAIPVAGAKWGYGKTIAAFTKATRVIGGPTFRAAMKAHMPGKFNAEDMAGAVIKAVANDPVLGKWARGENSHLKQLLDRGIISSTFATEVGAQSQGSNHTVQRVFDYARILPQMAEVYNRVSTALAGLELTGGDLSKTADFVRESHVDYTQSNKTRVAKTVAKVPGANTITMFKTYVQGMRHLLYSNVKNMVTAETKSRAEAAKTVAGLIVAQSIFAGVVKGAALEPLRLGVYAYNQLFGDEDSYFSLDNSIRRFVSDAVGNKKAADAISGGLPHLLGFDLSSRMGLSDLFLHDPPDLFHADSDKLYEFLGQQLGGPMGQMVVEQRKAFIEAMDRGDTYGMLTAVVPIKLLRDAGKAFELETTGKRSGNGGQLTGSSHLDAAYQVMGLKPADVARVQERAGTAIDYRNFANSRKARLMKAYGGTDDRGSVMDKMRAYNAENPGNRISYQDFVKQQRGAAFATNTADEGPERDPEVRALLDY